MKSSKIMLKQFFNNYWPILLICFLVGVFFWKFFVYGHVPIPGDFIVGTYYPWLDYKWGSYQTAVPVKNPLLADVPSLIYPIRMHAVEIMKNGEIPLWTSRQFGGYPLLATFQSAVLYPFNIIYFVTDQISAWSWGVILQPFLSLLFTYLFLRNLKLSKFAAVLGGVVYAFSGFNIIWLEYNVHAHVSAYIPLILLFIQKLVETGKFRWGVLLSLAVTFQVLAGYPQLVMYTFLLSFMWIIYIIKRNKYRYFPHGLKVGIFMLLGILLASPQLLPGFELLLLSQRLREGVSGGFDLTFLPIEGLLGFFAPDYFGNPTTGNYWGKWGWAGYANMCIYSGVVSIVFAYLAVSQKKKNDMVIFFLIVFILSLFFALPTPLTTKIFSSETFGFKSAVATRIAILTNFSLSSLSAIGFDLMIKRKVKDLIRATYIPWFVLFSVLIATLFKRYLILNGEQQLMDGGDSLQTLNHLRIGIRNLILPFLVTLSVTVCFVIVGKFRKSIKYIKIAIFMITVLELFRFGWKFTPFSEKEFIFPKTPVFKFLEEQKKPFRISGGDVIPISMWMSYGLESYSGYDAVYPSRVAKYIAVANSADVTATPMGRFGQLEGYTGKLFDLTNTKYIFSLKRNQKGKPDKNGGVYGNFTADKFKVVFEDETVMILENKDFIDRGLLYTDWEVIKGGEMEIINKLVDKNFPLKNKLLLEEDFDKFQKFPSNISSVKYVHYSDREIKMDVSTENPAFLFISDTWYPGWKAYVDGREETIFKADYVFRAIPIEKGVHTVEFKYKPASFYNGLKLSAISLLSIIFMFVYTKYINKNKLW